MRSIGTRRGWAMPIPMGRVVDLLASWSVHRHLAAVAYLFSAALAVTHLEDRLGYKVTTYFGLQYPQEVVYPVTFWLITCLYVLIVARPWGQQWTLLAARTAVLGLVVHLNVLAISFARDEEALAKLTAPYFVYYAKAVSAAVVVSALALSVAYFRASLRGRADRFWLPVAYLPVLHLALGEPRLALGAFAIAAIGILGYVVVHAREMAGDAARLMARLWQSESVFVAGAFALALLFRLVAAYRLGGMGLETVLLNSDDAQQYHANAMALLNGERITANWSVGYSGLVALLYWLTGVRVLPVLMIQAVVAASVPVAVYLIGRRAFGEGAGRVAAVLSALSQLLIYNAVNLVREMPTIVLVAWGLVLALELPRQGRGARLWAAGGLGLCLGVMISVDPVFLPIGAVVAAGAFFHGGCTIRQKAALVGIFLLAAAFVTASTNLLLIGRPVLVGRTGLYATHVSKDFNPYAQELYDRGINIFAFPGRSLPNFLSAPGENGTLLARKLWLDLRRFFFEGNTGWFDPIFLVNGSFLAANLLFYAYGFSIVGFLAGLKGLRAGPLRWERRAIYAVVALYSAAYAVLFFGMTRYRATVQPLLLFFTALGMAVLTQHGLPGLWRGSVARQATVARREV